jgi:hypothetical protein
VGVFNHAEKLEGIQFGLINVNKAGRIKYFPLFNFGF